jgi:hypothetical protein
LRATPMLDVILLLASLVLFWLFDRFTVACERI